ncbi:MAG: tyrosine-type recombinase/integrase, partial [Myxococcota bacterium]
MRTQGRKTRFQGVYALGKGRYRLRIYYLDPNTGKRRECDRVVEASSADIALDKKRALAQALEKGDTQDTQQHKKLGELATDWLTNITERQRSDGSSYLAPLSRKRYVHSVRRFIVPLLGDVDARIITAREVEAWRDRLVADSYRAATVNGHLRVLRQILAAIDNPAAKNVRALSEDDTRTTEDDPNLLNEDELMRFLQAAQDGWPQHYPLILVLFSTAMRIGTALALQQDDLRPDEGIIRVRRRVSGDEVLPGVKRSRRSADTPPLWPEVLEALETQRFDFNAAQRASKLVFPNKDGGLRSRTHLNKPFRDILEVAGIDKRLTPSSGPRRTAARLYRKVADSAVAKAVAGHLTDQMHQHYGRVDVEEKRQAAHRLRERLRLVKHSPSSEASLSESGTLSGTEAIHRGLLEDDLS